MLTVLAVNEEPGQMVVSELVVRLKLFVRPMVTGKRVIQPFSSLMLAW